MKSSEVAIRWSQLLLKVVKAAILQTPFEVSGSQEVSGQGGQGRVQGRRAFPLTWHG